MRILVLLLAAGGVWAQEWKAGLAKAVITPAEPVWMAGFGARKKPSAGVRRDLFVKALALEDRPGRVSVIVTTDIIGYTRAMSDEIWQRTGRPRGQRLGCFLKNSQMSRVASGGQLWPAPSRM